MRVVLDSNVLLSAFGFGGVCRDVLETCLLVHHVYLCEWILSEFHRKLVEKFRMPPTVADTNLAFLRERCRLVTPEIVAPTVCRDRKDLPVLGTVLAANAECLVTGDKDLLELNPFSDHLILTPRQFLERHW